MPKVVDEARLPKYAKGMKILRIRAGFQTQEDLAARTEELTEEKDAKISQRTVSAMETGKLDPATLSGKRLSTLFRALDVTPNEFVRETGSQLMGLLSDYVEKVESKIGKRRVPLIDLVTAGPGGDGGSVIGEVTIPDDWEGEFVAYYIEGDSMQPTIPSKAAAKVQVQDYAEPSQLVVAYCEEHGMVLKEFGGITPDGYGIFVSHNPTYMGKDKIIYSKDFKIYGVVISHEVMHHKPRRNGKRFAR